MEKINFKNNSEPEISAENLNQMQTNIENEINNVKDEAEKNKITGVKGNNETSYRTGNVNLTPANIGAVPTSGGTITGTLNTRALIPTTNKSDNLGSSSKSFKALYTHEIHFDAGNAITIKWSGSKIQFYVDGVLVKEI